ncbi:hypothetical protein [Myceligenerans pegani]|uniref:Uncharacterized protein n=1 Tax=Myceligenerans pegani TaxID=2776917 RepID=A0ABR9N441_9MICO|nr:hypothetical protein [Myceligenerans sp. TRM 65318]MBE1877941.1 hypothetical protein [Myceligenerans sp. TRM 65318]MBE3020212.1 hypothetical protein [Myceligenerans sp. TRM 65318]
MGPRPLAVAAAVALAVAVVGGCTVHGLSERAEPMPRVTPSPSPPDPCWVMAEAPGLAAWEVNEALPIDGVDVTHRQLEVLIEAGSGSCDAEPAEAVVEPCRPVSGPYDDVEGIHLWRDSEAFFEQEIASGARRILSESFDGYTEGGATFHWRAIAVEYEYPSESWASPAWAAIVGCADMRRDELGTGIVSLGQGDEPFLAATTEGSTVYIVETWLASDADSLPDTETGLPSADAVRMLLAWLQDQMRHV